MGQSFFAPCLRPFTRRHNTTSNLSAITARIGDTPSQLFRLVNGSILEYQGEAIVNAANERCLGGGGLDGQITKAGGNAMRIERENLKLIEPGIRCLTGHAVITSSGDGTLYHKGYCKYVIHAVGPRFHTNPTETQWQQLNDAYDNILNTAKANNLKKIALPLLSAGIYSSGNQEQIIYKIIEFLSTCLFSPIDHNISKSNCNQKKYWNAFDEVALYGYNDNEWSTMVKALNSLLILKQQ